MFHIPYFRYELPSSLRITICIRILNLFLLFDQKIAKLFAIISFKKGKTVFSFCSAFNQMNDKCYLDWKISSKLNDILIRYSTHTISFYTYYKSAQYSSFICITMKTQYMPKIQRVPATEYARQEFSPFLSLSIFLSICFVQHTQSVLSAQSAEYQIR